MLELVREGIALLEQATPLVTASARKAYRAARALGDWPALYWLSLELEASDRPARRKCFAEIAPHFEKHSLRQLHDSTVERWIETRTLALFRPNGDPGEEKICALSLPELEASVSAMHAEIENLTTLPDGLTPYDKAAFYDQNRTRSSLLRNILTQQERVLLRVSQQVHTYLCRLEQQLLLGQTELDIFEQNRRFVNDRLGAIAPEALEQLLSAYKRVAEGSSEARAHALTSCRRALKSLADRLYPPPGKPVVGSDGQPRKLTDDQFVNRLWQFSFERSVGTDSRAIIGQDVQELGARIERLNSLASKGVHSQVTEAEVHTCVFSTYNVIGVLLRLESGQSAAGLDPDALKQPPSQ